MRNYYRYMQYRYLYLNYSHTDTLPVTCTPVTPKGANGVCLVGVGSSVVPAVREAGLVKGHRAVTRSGQGMYTNKSGF